MQRHKRQNASDRGRVDSAKLMRNVAETKPMSKFDRFKLRFSRNKTLSTQFHIKPEEDRTCLVSLLWNVFSELCRRTFRNLVLWRISTSYLNFFVHALVFYLLYVHLFAMFIYWVITALYNNHGVECANSSQDWFYGGSNSVRHNIEIAFELSWITFTTVGYGNVAPSAYSSGCWGLRYLCAFEAFIGLVFFSLLGAIFFTKIGLTFGEAPVSFCRALCLNFNADSDEFPVLEMQIVHNKANQEGHEIVKASILCMVAIDVPFFKSSMTSDRNTRNISQNVDSHRRPSIAYVKQPPSFYSHCRGTKQMSYTVKLEGGEHPYFNRVWHCRHILNEDSPLLSDKVKEEIRRSGGWPSERRSVDGIRDALVHFHTMLVTMKGTSFRQSRTVYSEKRYNYDDIYVGCEFAELMYFQSNEREAIVDMKLINDIVPRCFDVSEPVEEYARYRSRTQHIITVTI